MWEEILRVAISNGLWAVLFVALLIYQLRDSASREIKYQQTIEVLTRKYDVIDEMKNDITDIKNSLKDKKNETNS